MIFADRNLVNSLYRLAWAEGARAPRRADSDRVRAFVQRNGAPTHSESGCAIPAAIVETALRNLDRPLRRPHEIEGFLTKGDA